MYFMNTALSLSQTERLGLSSMAEARDQYRDMCEEDNSESESASGAEHDRPPEPKRS